MNTKPQVIGIVLMFVIFSTILQGCGVATRGLIRGASIVARNSANSTLQGQEKVSVDGYECFPMKEAYIHVGEKVCLVGKNTFPQVITLSHVFSFEGFHLIGDEVDYPDIKHGSCVAAVGTVLDTIDKDGDHIYHMDIDDPTVNIYNAEGCE